MANNAMQAVTLVSLDTAILFAAYEAINPDGLPESCSIIRIINSSDQNLLVSYDGTTDHDLVIAGETIQLDLQANSKEKSLVANFKKGTIVYVNSVPGVGLVYLVGYYQPVN